MLFLLKIVACIKKGCKQKNVNPENQIAQHRWRNWTVRFQIGTNSAESWRTQVLTI